MQSTQKRARHAVLGLYEDDASRLAGPVQISLTIDGEVGRLRLPPVQHGEFAGLEIELHDRVRARHPWGWYLRKVNRLAPVECQAKRPCQSGSDDAESKLLSETGGRQNEEQGEGHQPGVRHPSFHRHTPSLVDAFPSRRWRAHACLLVVNAPKIPLTTRKIAARVCYTSWSMPRWGHIYREAVICLFGCACASTTVDAQSIPFAGGAAGIATLSADGRATIGANDLAVSLYAPKNGPAVNLFAGVHLSDYVSLQGNYVANANRVTLTASAGSDPVSFYEQQRNTTQHAAIVDLLVYFRERRQRVRPYL